MGFTLYLFNSDVSYPFDILPKKKVKNFEGEAEISVHDCSLLVDSYGAYTVSDGTLGTKSFRHAWDMTDFDVFTFEYSFDKGKFPTKYWF